MTPPNSDTDTNSQLVLETECAPDPVLQAGAAHDVRVDNGSTDRYDVELSVRILGKPAGSSVMLEDGTTLTRRLVWNAGTFGPGRSASWSHRVRRQPGTAKQHSLRTVATFTSDDESDPLDEDPPPTPPYHCVCTVDIAVP